MEGATPDPGLGRVLALGGVGGGGADAAAVEVDDLFALAQRKDDALIESICSLGVDEAGFSQRRKGIALGREMVA